MKPKRETGAKLAIILLALFITIFLCIGGGFLAHALYFMTNGEKTDATIKDINYHYSKTETESEHDVYIEYYAEGYFYKAELNVYSSGMHVGDVIEVYYIKDKPSKVCYVQFDIIVSVAMFVVCAFIVIAEIAVVVLTNPKRVAARRAAYTNAYQAGYGYRYGQPMQPNFQPNYQQNNQQNYQPNYQQNNKQPMFNNEGNHVNTLNGEPIKKDNNGTFLK